MTVEARRARGRGRPPRSESDRAAHHRRLVEAAMAAVREHGPETSIEQMADAAGVSKPVLYAEFQDKFGLVDEMAVELATRVEAKVVARQSLAGAGPFEFDHMIAAIVDALIDLMVDEPQLYAFIMRSFRMRDRGLSDNALARVIRQRAPYILGDLAEDIDPRDLDIIAAGVFGFVFGVVDLWMERREPDQDELRMLISSSIRGGINAVAAMSAGERH